MEDVDVGTVIAFIAAINRHDTAELSSLMAEDHTFVDAAGTTTSGRARMTSGWVEYLRMFPDYRIDVESILADGALVAVFGSASGTYRGNRGLVPANRIAMTAAWRAVVKDGKVKTWQVYADWTAGTRIMEEDAKSV